MILSRALNGLLTVLLHHRCPVWVSASLHHQGHHGHHGGRCCILVGAPRRVVCSLATPPVLWLCACGACCCCMATGLLPWLSPAACPSGVPLGAALVRGASSGLVALGAPVGCSAALVPSPYWGHFPPDLLRGGAGHVEAGQDLGAWCLPLAPAKAGALGSLRVVPVWVAPASVFGCLRCGVPACVDPITHASTFPYLLSFEGGIG